VKRAKRTEPETYLLSDAESRFPSFLPGSRATRAKTKKTRCSWKTLPGASVPRERNPEPFVGSILLLIRKAYDVCREPTYRSVRESASVEKNRFVDLGEDVSYGL